MPSRLWKAYGKIHYSLHHVTASDDRALNISEAMKFKREIGTICGIDVKMLDIAEAGLVLYVERKTLNADLYKLLANFAAENELSLQLDIGNFIISKHALTTQAPQ